MSNSVTLGAAGTSEWLKLPTQTVHRIDVDVPSGVSSITYTIETTHSTSGEAKTLKKPSDVDANWSFTDSAAFKIEGQGHIRLNISSYTGTGDVTLTKTEARVAS